MELPRPKGEVVLLAARLGIGDEVDGTVRICQAQAGLRGEPAQGRERGRAPGRIGSSCACTAGYRASGRPKRRRSSVTILRVARGSMASTDASARSLHAEMSGHLGYERHAPQGRGLGELPQQRSRQWARRCHADPPQLHGPYLTSTRKVDNKTVTRTLDSAQADARRTLLDSARRLRELTSELKTLTLQQLRDDPAEPDP